MKIDYWLSQKRGAFLTSRRKLKIFEMLTSRYSYLRPYCPVTRSYVLCTVHVSIKRGITVVIHIQTTCHALTIVFLPTYATRLTRIPLRDIHNLDTLHLRPIRENVCESVERPPVIV